MNLFSQKRTGIYWDVDRNNHRTVTKFHVIERNQSDFEPNHIRNLTFSEGNMCMGWGELSELDLTLQIWRIFMDYDFPDKEFKRECLLQCGQIEELVGLRETLRGTFYNDLFMDEFMERFYAIPI